VLWCDVAYCVVCSKMAKICRVVEIKLNQLVEAKSEWLNKKASTHWQTFFRACITSRRGNKTAGKVVYSGTKKLRHSHSMYKPRLHYIALNVSAFAFRFTDRLLYRALCTSATLLWWIKHWGSYVLYASRNVFGQQAQWPPHPYPSWFDRSRWNLARWEVLGGSIT